jgi:hypothetical protein
VCDHTEESCFLVVEEVELRALNGDDGGDTAFDGPFDVGVADAVELRVDRFVGDVFVGDSVGKGSKSLGWLRVATILTLFATGCDEQRPMQEE